MTGDQINVYEFDTGRYQITATDSDGNQTYCVNVEPDENGGYFSWEREPLNDSVSFNEKTNARSSVLVAVAILEYLNR